MGQDAEWIWNIQECNSRTAAEPLISAYYDKVYHFTHRRPEVGRILWIRRRISS